MPRRLRRPVRSGLRWADASGSARPDVPSTVYRALPDKKATQQQLLGRGDAFDGG